MPHIKDTALLRICRLRFQQHQPQYLVIDDFFRGLHPKIQEVLPVQELVLEPEPDWSSLRFALMLMDVRVGSIAIHSIFAGEPHRKYDFLQPVRIIQNHFDDIFCTSFNNLDGLSTIVQYLYL